MTTDPSRRMIGMSFLVAGCLIALIGLVGMLTAGDDADGGEQAAVSTTEPVATTTIAAETTSAPSTIAATSTAEPTEVPTTVVSTTAVTTTPTTTTPTTTTPTTIAVRPPAELIAAFVDDYVAAIESGDVDFLLDRLHPAVLDQFDTELCRTFIEREILALRNYRLTGDIEGPTPESIGGRDFESYSAPIAFDFQGESFDGGASWGLVDGEVRWFTTCR